MRESGTLGLLVGQIANGQQIVRTKSDEDFLAPHVALPVIRDSVVGGHVLFRWLITQCTIGSRHARIVPKLSVLRQDIPAHLRAMRTSDTVLGAGLAIPYAGAPEVSRGLRQSNDDSGTERPRRRLCSGARLGSVPRAQEPSMALAVEAAELIVLF